MHDSPRVRPVFPLRECVQLLFVLGIASGLATPLLGLGACALGATRLLLRRTLGLAVLWWPGSLAAVFLLRLESLSVRNWDAALWAFLPAALLVALVGILTRRPRWHWTEELGLDVMVAGVLLSVFSPTWVRVHELRFLAPVVVGALLVLAPHLWGLLATRRRALLGRSHSRRDRAAAWSALSVAVVSPFAALSPFLLFEVFRVRVVRELSPPFVVSLLLAILLPLTGTLVALRVVRWRPVRCVSALVLLSCVLGAIPGWGASWYGRSLPRYLEPAPAAVLALWPLVPALGVSALSALHASRAAASAPLGALLAGLWMSVWAVFFSQVGRDELELLLLGLGLVGGALALAGGARIARRVRFVARAKAGRKPGYAVLDEATELPGLFPWSGGRRTLADARRGTYRDQPVPMMRIR